MIIISINQAIKCLGRTDHWVKETNFPLKHKLEIIRIKMNSLVWIFYCNYSTANTRILLNLNQLNILHIKHSSPIVHLYISILEKSENETTLHKKIIMIRTSSTKYLHCQFCCMELFIHEYTCKKACTKRNKMIGYFFMMTKSKVWSCQSNFAFNNTWLNWW